MKRASCWIARFLVLAVLAPAVAPAALARSASIGGAHCVRRGLERKAVSQTEPPCHGNMQGSMAESETARQEDAPTATVSGNTEVSLRASDSCCQNHDCCSRLGNSHHDGFLLDAASSCCLALERAGTLHNSLSDGKTLFGSDSARAPPLN